MLMVWIVICVMAYFVQSHMMFYFIAALVGMVLGGIQAISRSTYSKIIPQESKDVNCLLVFMIPYIILQLSVEHLSLE